MDEFMQDDDSPILDQKDEPIEEVVSESEVEVKPEPKPKTKVKEPAPEKDAEFDDAYDAISMYDSIEGGLLRAESVAAFIIKEKDSRLRGGFFARATRALRRGGAVYVSNSVKSDYERALGAYLNESKPSRDFAVYRKAT